MLHFDIVPLDFSTLATAFAFEYTMTIDFIYQESLGTSRVKLIPCVYQTTAILSASLSFSSILH